MLHGACSSLSILRHRDQMIDIFAGQLFTEQVFKSAALAVLRRCLFKPSPIAD
jgi:hypothetical protein